MLVTGVRCQRFPYGACRFTALIDLATSDQAVRSICPSVPMSAHRRLRVVFALAVLALWLPATAFFAAVGVQVARELAQGHGGLVAPIVNVRAALITAAYSLGGAVIGLGLAWLALPRDRDHGVRWAAAVWLGMTALLLAMRRVDGAPLLAASLVACGIGLDVSRRLMLAALAAWHSAASV